MRILTVHNQFQQYAGPDIVAAADDQILAEHNDVTSYRRHNNEIASAGFWDKGMLGVDTVYSRRTVREIVDLVKYSRPEIAYIHNVFPLISPSLFHVLHRLRVPTVHVIHDYRLWCPNSRFYINDHPCVQCQQGNYWPAVHNRCVQENKLYSAVYAGSLFVNRKLHVTQKIGGFICLTEFSRQVLRQSQVAEDKLYVCPNHIDTSNFMPRYGGGDYVLFVGGLYRDKGVMTVAKAFAQIPHIPIKLVGAGPQEVELRDYIQQNRLSNIELVGFKNGQEKLEYFRNSKFTIVASQLDETFGLVVLEAYASGKPVVASRAGSLPYLVEPEQTGLLFKPQDADDLAAKVRWLYERPEGIERMGRNARAVVEQKYDRHLRYDLLMAIFEKVIQKSGWN
jgi:glycosyltransferase involved in cell wall biosynthesis